MTNEYIKQLEERCKQLEDCCSIKDKEIFDLKNKYEPIVETVISDSTVNINDGINTYQVYTSNSTFQAAPITGMPTPTISVQESRLISYMEQEKEVFKKLINEVMDEREKNGGK